MTLDELFRLNGAEGYDVDPYTNRVLHKDSVQYRQLRQRLHGDEYDSSLSLSTLRQLYKNNVNTNPKKKIGTRHPVTNKVMILGSDEWNEVFRYYNWDGKNKKFTTRRDKVLPAYYDTIANRREFRRGKYAVINKQINDGSILMTSMGSFATVYHVEDGKVDSVHRESPRERHDFRIKSFKGGFSVCKKETNDERIVRSKDCLNEDKEIREMTIREEARRMA